MNLSPTFDKARDHFWRNCFDPHLQVYVMQAFIGYSCSTFSCTYFVLYSWGSTQLTLECHNFSEVAANKETNLCQFQAHKTNIAKDTTTAKFTCSFKTWNLFLNSFFGEAFTCVLYSIFPINSCFFPDSSGSYTDSLYSFIFSFKNHYGLEPFKLHVKNSQHAIYGNSGYGPTFGSGHDIYIANSAGYNTNSYSNLGDGYVQLAGYRQGSNDARSLLAGSYKFQPHEVEVFYQTHKG